jgi:hypothetical protein
MKSLAEFIPAKARAVIYSILGTAIALEAIFDLIDSGWETKILQTLSVLGFGLAAANASTKGEPLPPPPPRDRGSSALDVVIVVVLVVFVYLVLTRFI